MAVERRVIWIIVWSICGFFFLLVLLLTALLLCCKSAWWRNRQKRQSKEEQERRRQERIRVDAGNTINRHDDYNFSEREGHEWSEELDEMRQRTPSHRYHFTPTRSSSAADMYPGYTRLSTPELICIPPSTITTSTTSSSYNNNNNSNLPATPVSYSAPQVVRIVPHDFHAQMQNRNSSSKPDLQSLQESLSFDILVDVKYVDPAISQGISFQHNLSSNNNNNNNNNNNSNDNNAVVLLGNDAYYSNEFLLYTSPLEFTVPGTYIIHAHTVHPFEKKVGCVHEFIFTITDPTEQTSNKNQNKNKELVLYNPGQSASLPSHINNIEIDLGEGHSHHQEPGQQQQQQQWRYSHHHRKNKENDKLQQTAAVTAAPSETSTFATTHPSSSSSSWPHKQFTLQDESTSPIPMPQEHINNQSRYYNNIVPMLGNTPSQMHTPFPFAPFSSSSSCAASSLASNAHTTSTVMVFAPHIIPDSGEVTTSTPIVITPHEKSRTIEQLRYSVDGTYPNLIYNGPFTLSLPPPAILPEQTLTVTIKAIAIAAFTENTNMPIETATALPAATYLSNSLVNNNQSSSTNNAAYWQNNTDSQAKHKLGINSNVSEHNEQPQEISGIAALHLSNATINSSNCSTISQAILQVRRAGYSYYDPALPAPSMRLHAIDAQLYFDESKIPAHCKTVYQLIYIRDARKWNSEKSSKVHFSRHKCIVYDGVPVAITDDIARVYAWTVDEVYLREKGVLLSYSSTFVVNNHNKFEGANGLVISDDEENNDDDDDDEDVRDNNNNINTKYTNNHNNSSSCISQNATSGRLRSQATIYDCTQGKTKRANPHHNRLLSASRSIYESGGSVTISNFGASNNRTANHNSNKYNYNNNNNNLINNTTSNMGLLPPPIICVTCKEMDLEFDDPPANAFIAYTLNNTEPTLCDVVPFATAGAMSLEGQATVNPHNSGTMSNNHFTTTKTSNNKTQSLTLYADADGLHTYRYQPHTRIRVTLMETEGVYITARMFISLSPLNMSYGVSSGTLPVTPSAAQETVYSTSKGNLQHIAPPSTSSIMSRNTNSLSVINGGSTSGANVIGYRYGNLFRRGFFFHNNA